MASRSSAASLGGNDPKVDDEERNNDATEPNVLALFGGLSTMCHHPQLAGGRVSNVPSGPITSPPVFTASIASSLHSARRLSRNLVAEALGKPLDSRTVATQDGPGFVAIYRELQWRSMLVDLDAHGRVVDAFD